MDALSAPVAERTGSIDSSSVFSFVEVIRVAGKVHCRPIRIRALLVQFKFTAPVVKQQGETLDQRIDSSSMTVASLSNWKPNGTL